MPRLITFQREIVGGNAGVNPTYDIRKVFPAFARIETYFDVVFRQVGGGANLRIINTNRIAVRGALMWANGNAVYIPTGVNWGTNYVAMIGAMVHEVGHVFRRYSNPVHNVWDAGIMRDMLYDPGQNFTVGDFHGWYNFARKPGSPAPWSEPNRWRTVAAKMTEYQEDDVAGGSFGHASFWERFRAMFDRSKMAAIEAPADYERV